MKGKGFSRGTGERWAVQQLGGHMQGLEPNHARYWSTGRLGARVSSSADESLIVFSLFLLLLLFIFEAQELPSNDNYQMDAQPTNKERLPGKDEVE